jgi:O-antigen ligase
MRFILIVIGLASLVDFLSIWSIGGVRLSGISWISFFFLSIFYLFSRPISIRNIKEYKWFLLYSVYITLRSFESKNLFYAFVDNFYSFLIVIIGVLAYHTVKVENTAEKIENYILRSIYFPLILLIIAYLAGYLKFSELFGFIGPLGPRSVSLYFVSIISLAISSLSYDNSKKLRKLSFLSIVTGVLLIFISLSRTAFLSLIVIFFLFSTLKFRIKKIITVIPIIFLIIFVGIKFEPFAERVNPEVYYVSPGFYTSGRATVWPVIIEEGLKHPLFGYGTGNAKVFMEENFKGVGLLPHNEYLRIFYDGGVMGLILFLSAWIQRLKKHWLFWKKRERNNDKNKAKFHLASILGTVGILVSAIFDNVFLYVFMLVPICLIYGICDKLEVLSKSKGKER